MINKYLFTALVLLLSLGLTACDSVEDAEEVIIEDLVVGTGEFANIGDRLEVYYIGTLEEDGTEFDRKTEGTPFIVNPLGLAQVIAGWNQGLDSMRVGGTRKLTIPPSLGYGEFGSGELIPGNATLIFEIQLLKVTKRLP